MSDNHPIRKPPTAPVVESPPRAKGKPADPCAMVVFGAGGDMTKRLLVPALYNLSRTQVLPETFALIGVDLAEATVESWREHLFDMLKSFVGNPAAALDIEQIDEAAWKRLANKMSYVQGDLTKPETYERIRGSLDEAEKAHGTQGNVIFYLGVAGRFLVEQFREVLYRRVGHDADEFVAASDPLIERRCAHAHPLGHGGHREPGKAFGLEDAAGRLEDLRGARAFRCRHPILLSLIPQ